MKTLKKETTPNLSGMRLLSDNELPRTLEGKRGPLYVWCLLPTSFFQQLGSKFCFVVDGNKSFFNLFSFPANISLFPQSTISTSEISFFVLEHFISDSSATEICLLHGW